MYKSVFYKQTIRENTGKYAHDVFLRFIRKNLCKYAHACMTNPTVSSVSCSFIHKKPCKYAHACRFIHKRTCINQCFINKLYVKIQVNMRMTCFCDLYAKTYVNMHTHA